ncbi:MAG: acyltransferase [Devosia sp.]
MATRSGRLDYVESIRGLACLMLVSFHVVGSAPDEGLGLQNLHPLRIINDGLDNSRMAIFSFISGFVLSAIIVSVSKWEGSVISKARRLLIPMAAVGAIHYGLRALSGVDQQPFLSIFFTQYAHFWFLQAMFVLTVMLLTLSLLLNGKSDKAALILFLVLTPMFLFAERWNPNVMAMYQGLYLAPFFYSGHLFAAFLKRRRDGGAGDLPSWLTVVAGVVLAALLAFNLAFILDVVVLEKPWSNVHRLFVGLASALFLFLLKPNAKFLVWVGSYTYVIYLFHVIFAAAMRSALLKLFPHLDPTWFFVPCVAAGFVAPILVQKLALKNDVTALLFLGIDRKKKPARPDPLPDGPLPQKAS